jgi:GNAT superfamily N-acetyltransferase
MDFVIEPRPYEDADVQTLVEQVQQEYVVRYGGPDRAEVDPTQFASPNGTFVIGLLDGVPVAMGGWRRQSPERAELKRMYVAVSARRRGLARRILADLEARAWAAGIEELVLNTGREQPEAIELYESCGYTPVPGFGYYADAPRALFYGKSFDGKSVPAVSRG